MCTRGFGECDACGYCEKREDDAPNNYPYDEEVFEE